MNQTIHIPRPPLHQYIAFFWTCEDPTAIQIDTHERILPHGQIEIIIGLAKRSLVVYSDNGDISPLISDHTLIGGAHTRPFLIDTHARESVIGISFRHGGAFPFLGYPLDDFTGLHVSLTDIWGSTWTDLHGQLYVARNHEVRFALLERFFMNQLRQDRIHHPAVYFALMTMQDGTKSLSLADITREVGLSSKRFIDLFRTQIGLTPRQFIRVRRFQHVVHDIHNRRASDSRDFNWLDVALRYGYYDQSHFNRDFKAFSGVTPEVFRQAKSRDVNHLTLLD